MTSNGWDVIVVGAGSSGAALAVRSAEQGKRVLLLEAGPDYRSAEMHEAWRSPNPIVALLDPTAAEGMVWTGLDCHPDREAAAGAVLARPRGGRQLVDQRADRDPAADGGLRRLGGSRLHRLGTGRRPALLRQAGGRRGVRRPALPRPRRADARSTGRRRSGGARWTPRCTARRLAAGLRLGPRRQRPSATGVSPYPINSRGGRRVSVNDAYLEPARDLANLTHPRGRARGPRGLRGRPGGRRPRRRRRTR